MAAFVKGFVRNLRFGIRRIWKNPALALVAVSILSLGIGGSTSVFNVLYQVLLKPLPYPHAERLLFIHNHFPKSQISMAGVSGFDYAEIKRHKDVFAGAGFYFWNDLTLTGLGAARHINVVNASASVFAVLGVQAELGRTFSEAEDQNGAPGTVLLSDGLWRSALGADPNVLGRIIHLNGTPYAIVGVMPQSFQFPSHETQLWIPTALRRGEFTIQGGRLEKWLHMVARLSPGVTVQQATAALLTVSDTLSSQFPSFYPQNEGWRFAMRAVADEQTERIRFWIYLAFGAVFSVLLIACINVSGLLLIQESARSGEIAIRRAVGATKQQIIGQLLTETSVLVFAGLFFGLLFALWAIHLINLYGPLGQPVTVQSWSLIFALGLVVISTLCAGLLPALLSAQVPVEQALKGGGTRTSTRSRGWRNAIVAAQIAVAVTVMFTATQLNRSFLNLTRVPAGFQPQQVWTGAVDLPSHNYTAEQSWNSRFFEPLLSELKSSPGVQAASLANAIPFNPSGIWTEGFRLPMRVQQNRSQEAQIALALPGYFETIGIPLVEGRTFTEHDRAGAPPVAVIDRELSHRYFTGEEPIGKLITVGGEANPATIIGVVGSVHNSDLGGPPVPEVYFPELQERTESAYLVLRTRGDLDPTAVVRNAITRLDPGVALYDVKFMDDRVAESLKIRRFVAFLLNGLAAMGMALSIVGLYGSLAHMVQLRQREIGIRVALGAMRSQVVSLVLARASVVVGAGLLAGAVGGVLAEYAVRSQLFGVQATDATIWMVVIGSILIASALSVYVPAWRAGRIDPSLALRHE